MEFSERKKEILNEVIIKFIDNAEPVSSQSIAENLDMDLSSATIRKEMAELEEMGYLTHPHTSAGRMPSDKGYRFYVDNVISESIRVDAGSKENLPEVYIDKDMEMEAILQKSTEQLSQFTNYLSMIVAPAIYQSRFRHVELLKFEDRNFLLVLITDTGRVYKRSFSLGEPYNTLDFQRVTNILNSQLRNKNIVDIDISTLNIPESDTYLLMLLKKIITIIKGCAEENLLYNRLFVHGTAAVLQQPEFIDLKKIRSILRVIENEYLLMKLLLELSKDNELIIRIGPEIFNEGTDDLSLVASKYKIYGNSTGAVGILGPKRMNYIKVINILNVFIENLKKVFNSPT
ncbi:MAG: heat-inducible transcription repressor HrcA [Actinobacteria bacterium]|nr:heat-inducible transcription repressor HrcA [Actinomycetota bacterium]